MGLDHFLLLYTLVNAIRRSLCTDDERTLVLSSG